MSTYHTGRSFERHREVDLPHAYVDVNKDTLTTYGTWSRKEDVAFALGLKSHTYRGKYPITISPCLKP